MLKTPSSSGLSETQPLVQKSSRSLCLPFALSACFGIIMGGAIGTTVLNPDICGASQNMGLHTALARTLAAGGVGCITTVVGTIAGYFCQTEKSSAPLAAPLNDKIEEV